MKKTFLIGVLSLLTILQSCTKVELTTADCGTTTDWQLGVKDTFIINSAGGLKGLGLGNYKIVNQQLYFIQGSVDSLLPYEKYLIANDFVIHFPKELKDNPNQKWIGACGDTYVLGVEVRLSDGTRQSWLYDSCPSNKAPAAAQCYFSEITKSLYLQ